MVLDDQDPEMSEAELGAALAERGLDCSPADRQGILAVARFLQQATARVRLYESEAAPATWDRLSDSEADEASS
jgi:hypothetical protein